MLDQSFTPLPQNLEPKKNIEAFKALLEVDAQERNMKIREGYTKAYVMSVLLPPIGIYYCAKFLFFSNGTDEDIKAGITSLVITLISLSVSIWISVAMFRGILPAGTSVNSLQNLSSPDSQKTIINLYK